MCPDQPRSFFSISSKKISPASNGFSENVSALAKLVLRYATVLSSSSEMLAPWYGWKRASILRDVSDIWGDAVLFDGMCAVCDVARR